MAATISDSALSTQVGGDHYKSMPIQPVEFALVNRLNTAQANIIKYVCRYPKKGGARDLEKAHHYCDIWLQVHETYQLPLHVDQVSPDAVDTFVEVNQLAPTVAEITVLVCVAPDRSKVDRVKTLIMDLLAGIHG